MGLCSCGICIFQEASVSPSVHAGPQCIYPSAFGTAFWYILTECSVIIRPTSSLREIRKPLEAGGQGGGSGKDRSHGFSGDWQVCRVSGRGNLTTIPFPCTPLRHMQIDLNHGAAWGRPELHTESQPGNTFLLTFSPCRPVTGRRGGLGLAGGPSRPQGDDSLTSKPGCGEFLDPESPG